MKMGTEAQVIYDIHMFIFIKHKKKRKCIDQGVKGITNESSYIL